MGGGVQRASAGSDATPLRKQRARRFFIGPHLSGPRVERVSADVRSMEGSDGASLTRVPDLVSSGERGEGGLGVKLNSRRQASRQVVRAASHLHTAVPAAAQQDAPGGLLRVVPSNAQQGVRQERTKGNQRRGPGKELPRRELD